MNDVVFRVSGPEIEERALRRNFHLASCASKGMFKVVPDRTAHRLLERRARTGEDVVALKIWGGPLLILHPEHARELLRVGAADGSDVVVTNALPWTSSRGGVRAVLPRPVDAELDWFAILTPRAGNLDDIARAIDPPAPVLYTFDPRVAHEADAPPALVGPLAPVEPDRQHVLLFLHGLFGSASTSFRQLADHASEAEALVTQYRERNILAFDYPALMQGPVDSALALVERLPKNLTLDLLTHSSGGLIAEVLVRAAHASDGMGTDVPEGALRDPEPAAAEAHESAALTRLRNLLREKGISVRRMVRVACPARGTSFASGRLDAWLSVLEWVARSSSAGLRDRILPLLTEAARCGARPEQLPGLAAMLPDSVLMRWLNAPLSKLESELFVVAGDSNGDGLMNWLQTLVSDAYFWTDNDMVFQTRSMYGGVPRAPGPAGPRYLLKEDGRVTHFNYFSSGDLVRAIVDALLGKPGKAWAPIGPASWRGRGPRTARDSAGRDRSLPTVLLLPDVFGSVLTDDKGTKRWLNQDSVANIECIAFAGKGSGNVVPARLLRAYYGELREYLARTHNVVDFPYDWRAGIEQTAELLGARIAELLQPGALGEQPLRIVAHGMGALVVRAWHAGSRSGWSRLMARPGSRVVLVAPPNAGCWLPLRLLTGDDTFGTLFASVGTLGADARVRETLAGMPGLVQLQAGLLPRQAGALPDDAALNVRHSWLRLERSEHRACRGGKAWHGGDRDAASLDRWGVPSDATLAGAAALWKELESALPALLRDADRIAIVAGTGHATVTGTCIDGEELYLTTTEEGDRHVTLDSAALPGVPLYVTEDVHEALTCTGDTVEALADLLSRGSTDRLRRLERDSRTGAAIARGRQDERRLCWHGGQVLSGQDVRAIMFAAGALEDSASKTRLEVNVHHGDLRFIRVPLMVGHYKSMTLTGAEAVIDGLLSHRMTKALRAGVYPERKGSFQIFENGRHSPVGRRKLRYIPRPSAAVVVGLDEEGKLTAQILSYTVRTGVIAYAERYAETHPKSPSFELAATLIGSGGSGVSVSAAALALVQGVAEANMRLREAGWPTVRVLTIVEMYLDRATDAWRVLQMQAESMPDLHVGERLVQGDGGLRRPLDTSYRGATYDFISAVGSADSSSDVPKIAYSLDTRRARTEVRAQQAQGALVRDLVRKACCTTRPDKLIGRTLFNLLIPVEIEPYLTGSSDMLMELDGMTATLPWEMLDTDPPQLAVSQAAVRPWAIRSKVLRKLRTEGYRDQVRDASLEDQMLVIGAPKVTDARYEPLPGARSEARVIAEVARAAFCSKEAVTELTDDPMAMTVINALFARNYRIVHIAGHGTGTDDCGRGGGVVLSGEATFLGANEIRAMRVTPELVFLNCCHLGSAGGPQYDRVTFAAGVATQLINIGVRCVVAAGWAIEDGPAEVFAQTFYRELFAGKRFIDAVGAARQAAWEDEPKCNTWAAYQCYGDPEWSWRPAGAAVVPRPDDEYAGVASPLTLVLVLETIATELVYTIEDHGGRNKARLEFLEQRFGDLRDRGDVAEAFARAFSLLPDRRKALEWCRNARKASDNTVSLRAIELHAEQLSVRGATEDELREAIRRFEAIQATYEVSLRRYSMLGNACRRLSVLLRSKNDAASRAEAARMLEQAREQYELAAAREADSLYRFYPLRAALACRLRAQLLARLDDTPLPEDAGAVEIDLALTLREIQLAVAKEPQFWTTVAQTEHELIKGVARGNLVSRRRAIVESLRDLHNRINAPRYWEYVCDDAEALLQPYQAWMARVCQQPAVVDPDEDTRFDAYQAAEERRTADLILQQLACYRDGRPYHDKTEEPVDGDPGPQAARHSPGSDAQPGP